MNRSRIAVVVAAVAFFLGVIDVLLRCWMIGSPGLMEALQDPGKTFFHLFLLPPALFVLISRFPLAVVRMSWGPSRELVLILTLVMAVVTGLFWVADTKQGFCDRIPLASDLADSSWRSNILKARTETLERMGRERESLRLNPSEEPSITIQMESRSRSAMIAFLDHVEALRGPCAGLGDYWAKSSIRAKWASALSLVGILTAAALLWLLLIHGLTRSRVSKEFQESVFVLATLLSPWVMLRAYSEWWINFGATSSYPLVLAILLAVVVVGLAIVLRERPRLVITAGTITGLSTLAGVFAKWNPTWFYRIAEWVSDLDVVSLITLYMILGLAIVGLLFASLKSDLKGNGTENAPR